jgi:xanthine dehydrogenase molybdenum-binding subunit
MIMGREFSVVGKSLPRPDGVEKVTGAAEFAADIKLPGMLAGRILRSPYPHAKIVKIDTSKARKLPGVEAVITFADVPKKLYNRSSMAAAFPPPILAGEVQDEYVLNDKARFMGDAIAAVAATDVYTAEEALDLIEVEYEQLPATFDPMEAMKPESPIIHDGHERNIASTLRYPFSCGDVEQGFKEADVVVEQTFTSSKQKMCQMEPDTAVVSFDPTGKATIWSSNENPHLARRLVSTRIFDMGEGMLRWMTPAVGGGFGGRLSLHAEPICIALAKAAGKPVKLEYTREEDFFAHDSRTEQHQTMKMGVKRDGTITAIEQKILSDSGAYYSHSGSTSGVNTIHTLGLFRCPNVSGEVTVVYTNTPTCGGMRGYGNPEGAFAMQQLVDLVCEKIGMDPLEFRLKNFRRIGEPSCWVPSPLESCALEQCMKQGAEAIGWKEKRAAKKEGTVRRGVGMSIMTHATGAGGFLLERSNAFIKLNEDGSANLTISPCEMGQGTWGVMKQMAAEELGLRYEDIHIVTGDTDTTLFDIGSHASRTTYCLGNAVVAAAREAKKRLLNHAGTLLKVPSEELEVKGGRIYLKATPEKGISVAEVVADATYDFALRGLMMSGQGFSEANHWCPNFQAGFAEVEVNTETGEVKIIKYVVAHDIGKAINPMNVESQLEGGSVQGLGFALYEDFVVDPNTGATITDSFATYKIPSSLDIPEIQAIIVEEPVPSGPFGAKGVGESGLNNVAAAIANAVYNAIGVGIYTLPITPEKVLEALEAKE